MTFAPTKKTSKTRTRRRTTNWIKLTAKKLLNRTNIQYDETGQALGLRHFVSPITGKYYSGKSGTRQVLNVEKKQQKRIEKIKKLRA